MLLLRCNDSLHIQMSKDVAKALRSLSVSLRCCAAAQVMLGVDRLDMIKGIPQKLLAFEKFLEEHPEWRDKVLLVQIAVPSRTDVPEYQVCTPHPACTAVVVFERCMHLPIMASIAHPGTSSVFYKSFAGSSHEFSLIWSKSSCIFKCSCDCLQRLRSMVHEIVGRINGHYGTLTHVPIHHLDRQLAFHELCALYAVTDVALVTSLRDGMNLVSYEYVACQSDNAGKPISSLNSYAARSSAAWILYVHVKFLCDLCTGQPFALQCTSKVRSPGMQVCLC